MHPATRRFIRRVTVAYAVLATAWIFLSDRMLSVVADPATITELGTVKGIAFVTITSALLFFAMTRIPAGDAEQKPRVNGRSQPLFLVFLILIVTIAVIGVVAYRVQSTVLKQTEFDRLQAIAQLKVDDITRWMNGRRANASSFSRNPAVIDALRHWLARGGKEEEGRLLALLGAMRGGFGFSSVVLMDPSGRLLFAEGEHLSAPEPGARATVDAVTSGETVFVDLHRDAPGVAANMAFVVPVFERAGDGGGVIAVLQLDLRADRYLYPYIQSWPLPATTGETILVRREGEDVIFLNELRHRAGSALSLRLPVTTAELPAAQAILYQKQLVEGLDYRGVRVLAAARPVPGTSWTLIAKVDEAEALAGLKQLAFTTGILILAALAVSVCFVVFLWQRQRLRAALTEIAQGRALEEAEIRFRSTFEQAAVGIAHVGPDGRFLRVNQQLCSILGYDRDELLTKTFQDITFACNLGSDIAARGRLLAGEIQTYSVEKRYCRKDGELVWAGLTSTVIRNAAGEPDYFVTVIEDISRRKEAEEAAAEARQPAGISRQDRRHAARDDLFVADAVGRFDLHALCFSQLHGAVRPAAGGCGR